MANRVEGILQLDDFIDDTSPVFVTGQDYTGLVRGIRTDEDGRLVVVQNIRSVVPGPSGGLTSFLISSAANQTLVAAPGLGLHIYVTHLSGAASNTNTGSVDFKQGAADIRWGTFLEFKGEKFNVDLTAAWKLPENTAFIVQIGSTKSVRININFFIAS